LQLSLAIFGKFIQLQPGSINVSEPIQLGFWVLARIAGMALRALPFSTGIIFDSDAIL